MIDRHPALIVGCHNADDITADITTLVTNGKRRIRSAYRHHHQRLATRQDRIDPDNVFHINQQIQPSPGTSGEQNVE